MPDKISMFPIGEVRHHTVDSEVPRHWSISNLEGELILEPSLSPGLTDIRPGDRIVVLFVFHKSPPFSPELLFQKPPHKERKYGVFSICSPKRPNPIGFSVVSVLEADAERGLLRVRGVDMFNGTPILDIKPYWQEKSV